MQGHINPLMHLSSKLVSSSGFHITFILSEHHHALAQKRQQKEQAAAAQNEPQITASSEEELKFAAQGDGGTSSLSSKSPIKESEQAEEAHNGSFGTDPSSGKAQNGSSGSPMMEEREKFHGGKGKITLVGIPDQLPDNRTGGAEFRHSFDAQNNMRHGVELLLSRLQSSQSPVSFILADTFVDWAHQLAQQFHLPLVAFFTSNAASALIFLHAPSLVSEKILPFRDENDNFIATKPVAHIPGSPPIHPLDFPLCFTFPASHYRYQFVLRHHENLRYCSAMLMNSFEELESRAVAALRQDVPVLPIGPLLLLCSQEADSTNVNVNYWEEQPDCLKWLDTQKPSSVAYVSFGSIATMSTSQMEELALGLEATQQPFLWVVRSDSVAGSPSSNLPEGFLSRTKDRGLITSWAPQLAVLSHPAVGGFVTHCGWNSTLENLSIGGLPTVCWPLVAEQRMNCRIFVDDWKIGIEIKKREDGLVEKEEVERAVRALMQGNEGKEMKARAAKLQATARKAMEEGGSSVTNFSAFVESCRLNTLKPRS